MVYITEHLCFGILIYIIHAYNLFIQFLKKKLSFLANEGSALGAKSQFSNLHRRQSFWDKRLWRFKCPGEVLPCSCHLHDPRAEMNNSRYTFYDELTSVQPALLTCPGLCLNCGERMEIFGPAFREFAV